MFERLKRRAVYESDWVNLYVDTVRLPSGKVIESYHQLEYPFESVSIICKDTKDRICMIKSLRYTSKKADFQEWEVPAGGIDAGETPIQTACREFREETGLQLENCQLVHSYNPHNSISNKIIHIVFAQLQDTQSTGFDIDEVLQVHWLTIPEIKELIASGQINCGVSEHALLRYLLDSS